LNVDDERTSASSQRLLLPPTLGWLASAGLIVLVGCPLAVAFTSTRVGGRFPLLLFLLVVVGAAVTGRLLGGMIAAFISGLALTWFVLPPIHSFALGSSEVVALMLFVLSALGVSLVVASRERAAAVAAGEWQRSEDALARLQLALDAGELGSWSWVPATGEVHWDEALERIYGLEPGGFDGTLEGYAALLHAEDRDGVLEAVRHAISSASAFHLEHRVRRPDGEVVWVEGWGAPRLGEGGEVRLVMGLARDVSAERRRRDRLRALAISKDAAAARLRRLQRITQALADAMTVHDVARTTLSAMAAAVEAPAGWVAIIDHERGFAPLAWLGHEQISIEPLTSTDPSDDPVLSSVLATGEPVFDAPLEVPPGSVDAPAGLATPALAALPIVVEGAVRAVVHLRASEPKILDEDERALLVTVAGLAGQALARAALHEEAVRGREAAERLRRMAEELSAAVPPEDVGAAVVSAGRQLIRADTGLVYRLERDTLHLLAAEGYAPGRLDAWTEMELGTSAPVPDSIREGVPVVLEDRGAIEERYPFMREAAEVADAAVIAMPLAVAGEELGGLFFAFHRPHRFSQGERDLVRAVADQASQALARAGVYEAERLSRERARRLGRIADAGLSSLDADELFAALLPRARDALDADWARLLLTEPDGAIVARAADGVPSSGWFDTRYEPGEGFVGAVAQGARPLMLEEVGGSDFAKPSLYEGLVSVVRVPVVRKDRSLGVLELGWTRRRALRDDDRTLLELVASRVASSVERAELYRERDHLATVLARSVAPSVDRDVPGWDIAALYRPGARTDEIGGDLYAMHTAEDGARFLVVADVCGSGPEAAATMSRTRHLLQALTVEGGSPSSILRRLNRLLLAEPRADQAPFVTACLVRMEQRGEPTAVTIALGGHPLPLRVRADGAVDQVGRPGTLLGMLPEVSVFEVEVDLAERDALVLYTDGLVERSGGVDRLEDGSLEAVLRSVADTPAASVVEALRSELMEPDHVLDDVAVVVLRRTSGGT
jgi:PAS domain S-box-containing protein